jgi:hypothetical protein
VAFMMSSLFKLNSRLDAPNKGPARYMLPYELDS